MDGVFVACIFMCTSRTLNKSRVHINVHFARKELKRNAEFTGYDVLRRKAVKPPGFYRRLNTLSTADFECAGRCTRGSRLEVREDE